MSDGDTRPLSVQRNYSEHHGPQAGLRAQASRSKRRAKPQSILPAFCNASLRFLLSPAGSSLLVAFGFSIRAVEFFVMLLNVGVPVSAIQLIVYIFSIDTIDRWDGIRSGNCPGSQLLGLSYEID
jgi:hypothetical protein